MSWQVKPLGEVFNVVGGGTPSKKKPEYYGGSIPWATIRDMHSSELSDTEHSITEAGLSASSAKVIPAGEVIMASRVGLGKACLLEQDTAINQDIRALLPKKPQAIERRFCLYWLQSIEATIIGAGSGATVQGVKLPFIKSLPFPDIGLEEQKRIVAVLDQAFAALDRARANAEANLPDVVAIYQAELNSYYQEALEDNGAIRLADFATHITDGDHSPPPKSEKGIPFVTISNIDKQTGELSFESTFFVSQHYFDALKDTRKPNVGDLLYTVTGATLGIPSLVLTDREFCFQRHVAIIKPKEGVSSEWLLHVLRSSDVFDQATKGSTGAAQKTVSLKTLRGLAIPNVSAEEQVEAAIRLNSIWEKLTPLTGSYRQVVNDLNDLRQSILQKAFAGELT